jgi:murein DD-endopeptidase MepM/ murein hydrolase activator NlpD
MNTRLLHILLCAGLLAVAIFSALTYTANAQTQTIYVKLASGAVVPVTVDVPPGASLDDIQLPGTPVPAPSVPKPGVPSVPGSPSKPKPDAPKPDEPTPVSPGGSPQSPSEGGPAKKKKKHKGGNGGTEAGPLDEVKKKARRHLKKTPLRNSDGSPTPQNPGFVDALPGPSRATGVPNFVIRKFRVPIFLLPLYQAAGIQYGVRWEILAAINEIETDYGRNLNVSSAGALGWMQFMPATWRQWGVDANKDKRKDPFNPADAIFAAARYLKAAGYEQDPRRAIFAYNHADWYVDSVMLRARLISGVPADLVGSLTGLTEARFPVYARARYADDLAERTMLKKAKKGQNAANVVESDESRKGIEIFAKRGAPVIATNDGVIKKVGRSKRLGRFIVLQDVYGNRFTYGHLGSVARFYPVPKADAQNPKTSARAVKANGAKKDPAPKLAASAGRQPANDDSKPAKKRKSARSEDSAQASVPIKERLFAHPDLPGARDSGGLEQLLDSKTRGKGFSTFRTYFSQPFGLHAKDVRLRRLRKGSHVVGGTILGRIGKTIPAKAPHLMFEIRPAGRGAPRIDPKPILDGWKLLEATAIYRASGRNVLHGDDSDGMSIGQVLLLPKPQLQKRVLADDRIEIYPCGRDDVRTGQIDRRVLATLEYLAESGMKPTVTALKCGHSFMTASGNVSEHSSGNAVDIAKINGIPIIGHQDKGGITEQAVRRLMQLQGTMEPHQIISLLDYGRNTLALSDHNDHIHVGFQPLFGENKKLGKQAFQVLRPGQWSDLLQRLRKIDNPVVPTTPSKYAIPIKPKKRASDAHLGE